MRPGMGPSITGGQVAFVLSLFMVLGVLVGVGLAAFIQWLL